MGRIAALIVLLLPAVLLAQAATSPASRPDETIAAYPSGQADLGSPGFHKLVYHWTEAGQRRSLAFTLFLPHGYGQDDRRWPLLTFLAGLGDRGDDPGMAMAVGVPLEIGRSRELGQWMPMIVLTPQCPGDRVWDSPGMSDEVIRLVRMISQRLAVDRSRLYVTGFSDGGKGSWVMAAAEPSLFAAAAPIVSREYAAEQTAKRLTGTGVSCLVISGGDDPKSEPASANMVQALRKEGVDVTYAPVPGAGHFIWRSFYSQREFYQWLLSHRRGQPPAKERPSAETMVGLYASGQRLSLQQQLFEHRLQRGLDSFEPYWFVDNCAMGPQVGLMPRLRERNQVFVTRSLTADIPCRLQTTRQLPADKVTELVLEVGHQPRAEWELVLRVNEQEQLRRLINDQTAPGGWLQLTLSLRSCAGKEARLQLIHAATAQGPVDAYWSKVKLVENRP